MDGALFVKIIVAEKAVTRKHYLCKTLYKVNEASQETGLLKAFWWLETLQVNSLSWIWFGVQSHNQFLEREAMAEAHH